MWNRLRTSGKYKREKVTSTSGRTYASKLEAAVGQQLELLFDDLTITELKAQVRVKLSKAEIVYIPDFKIALPTGEEVFVEAKGFETPEWRLKRRLWLAYGPGPLIVIKGTHARLQLAETLWPEDLKRFSLPAIV